MLSTHPDSAKRYERLLRNSGFQPNGSPPKTESKPKRRSPDAIAKAAEAKRRKIEEYNHDPTADDGEDVKPNVKPESGLDACIKQERGIAIAPFDRHTGYALRTFVQYGTHPPQFPMPPKPAQNNSFDTAARDDYSPATPTQPSNHQTFFRPPNNFNSSPSSLLSAENMKQEADVGTPDTANSIPAPDEDSIFHEFCNSELFMVPMIHESFTSKSSPKNISNSRSSPKVAPRSRTSSVVEVASTASASRSKDTQPVCIILD